MKTNGGEPPKPIFPYQWVSDGKLDLDTRYLVKGLIDQASFTLIFGPSGSGKSFFTADLAQHVATGQAWRGRKVNQSLVIYVASEAGASIMKRFIGWRDTQYGEVAERIPLAVLTRGPSLLNKPQVVDLRDQLALMQDEAKLPLGLVIFDTLSRSMPGGDENNAEAMTEVIYSADYLRDQFKSCTAFVHHSGKDVERGARGHSSLFAAADCVLRVDERVATLDKVRDGVAGERFPFSLKPIELGLDQDGDKVTTCVLEVADASTAPVREMKGLGKNQRPVLDAIRTLVADEGVRSPGTSSIPIGSLTVSFERLCERMAPKYPGLKPWQVKKRVSEAVIGLDTSLHVGVSSDLLWLRR